MKASSHEKHAKQQWKKNKKNKKKQKVQTHGQGLGRGLAGDMGLNFFFLVFPWFFAVWPKPRENKNKKKTKSSDPWARSGLSTHKPKKQKTKKPRNQKNKKTKKPRLHTPRGGGQMQSVGSCLFFFWFFGFLVCVWIAIADVLSRDCQALSVVALEARSIHYSTAMFAMTWCIQPMNSREEWNSILSGCAIWGLFKITVPENCPYAALSRTFRALSRPSRIGTWDYDRVFV